MITRIRGTYRGIWGGRVDHGKPLSGRPDARHVVDVLEQLSLHEKKVLLALRGEKESTPQEVRDRGSFREFVEVMNAASWLQTKGLLTMRERVRRTYALARRQWVCSRARASTCVT